MRSLLQILISIRPLSKVKVMPEASFLYDFIVAIAGFAT